MAKHLMEEHTGDDRRVVNKLCLSSNLTILSRSNISFYQFKLFLASL